MPFDNPKHILEEFENSDEVRKLKDEINLNEKDSAIFQNKILDDLINLANQLVNKIDKKVGSEPIVKAIIFIVITALLSFITVRLVTIGEIVDAKIKTHIDDNINPKITNVRNELRNAQNELYEIKLQFDKTPYKFTALDNQYFSGTAIFYAEDEPPGWEHDPNVCFLTRNYDWKTTREVLEGYRNKTVFLIVDNVNNSIPLKVIDFIPGSLGGSKTSRMIQIKKSCLEKYLGKKKADYFWRQGYVPGSLYFPD